MSEAASVWALAARNLTRRCVEQRGSVEVYIPAPSVAITRVCGHLSVPLAGIICEAITAQLAGGQRLALFNQWERMETYDSGARRLLTNSVLANIRGIASQQFILGSRIVAMGVSTANLATSLVGLQLVAYPTRAAFEAALGRALDTSARRDSAA
ncbi:MAG: hypothetical protein BGO98_12870 [Myxococcales bacterium 68-20]|nr:MAG: hypothetical protein BGO98_12870 [Myxococcales bacterium 68-20]